jgi:plastocyanin
VIRPTPTRPIRLALAGLAASVLVALAPMSAGAATTNVKMLANDFAPANVTIARGGTVRWNNKHQQAFLDHDATSTHPRGYFRKDVRVGKAKTFTFPSAGRFLYVCTLHAGMDGTVTVPISVTKLTGPVRFRVTMASRSISSPWRHVVQVRKPGSSSFQTIGTTTASTVTWRPTKRGTHVFRSKVLNINNNQDSAWSPTVSRTY